MTPNDPPDLSWRTLWPSALLLIVASLAIHAVLVTFTAPALLTGDLIGTDAYMRLVRVRELALGGQWFDSVVDRSNWPYGDELHWTRPFDVLILMGTWVLTPFLGFTKALYWAGALVSPALQIVTSVALAWAVMPLLERRLLPLVMIAVLAQPAFMGYALAGRPDHHIFLLLFAVLQLGAFTRIATSGASSIDAERWAAWCGLLGAVGIWLSTELLLPLAIVLLGAGLAWVLAEGSWLRVNRRLTRTLTVGIAVALIIERPLREFGRVEYDRISVVHLALAITLWGVWSGIGWARERLLQPGWAWRAALCGSGGVALIAVMTALFPNFFHGPMAEIDPRLFAIWYDRITETEPMWPADLWEVGRVVAYLGGTTLAVVASLRLILVDDQRRWAWLAWMMAACAHLGLSLFYNIRFASGAELLAIPLLIVWLGPLYRRVERFSSELARVPLRASLTAMVLVGPIFLGGFIMGLGSDSEPDLTSYNSCNVQSLSSWMASADGPGLEPRTVLAMLDFGPELLYRTQHRVLAGPYYRNAAGIIDIHDAFTTSDVERRDQLLRAREVEWILICPARDEGIFSAPGNLYSSLLTGPVAGIRPVVLPEELAREFKLFEVSPEQLTQSGTGLNAVRPAVRTSQ